MEVVLLIMAFHVLMHVTCKLISEAIVEGCASLLLAVPKFDAFVTDDITQQCCLQLKNVNDIPRLYRRTNREVRCPRENPLNLIRYGLIVV